MPDPHEGFVEAQARDLRMVQAAASIPAAQRFGVVAAEGVALDWAQAAAGRLAFETFDAGQHSAGENVLLDEIGAAAVARKMLFADGDRLYQRLCTGL